jgi:hypothetical protein
LIDPAGGSPQTLAQTGDLAGLAADGTTHGYEPGAGGINAGGIWEAPVAGGTPTEVNDGGSGTSIPVMSPNGQFFMWDLDDLELGDFVSEYSVAAGPSSPEIDIDYDDVPPMSYGWLGTTPLTAHFDGTSWVCIGGQTEDVNSDGIASCGANAPTALIHSSTNDIVFPSGSPDGTQIVATVAPEGAFGGSIALYSASNGAFIRTIEVELIRARADGVSPAAAIRDYVLASVDAIATISPELWRGELGYLALMSPTVHRLSLEMTDRQADGIAAAIKDTTPVMAEVAKLQGIALASIYQIIFNHAGRRTHQGRSQTQISDELHPIIEAVLDELDRWLSASQR